MYTYLQQALPRVLIDRTLVETKKWKLPVRFSPTKENRMHQTKTSNKTDHDGFSPAVFRSRLEQTTPVTESVQLVEFVFFFSMTKHMLRMGSCVRFRVAITFSFLRVRRRFPLVSALEFRYCRVFPLANRKLTFDERVSCITMHDDFSPRSHRAVLSS